MTQTATFHFYERQPEEGERGETDRFVTERDNFQAIYEVGRYAIEACPGIQAVETDLPGGKVLYSNRMYPEQSIYDACNWIMSVLDSQGNETVLPRIEATLSELVAIMFRIRAFAYAA